MSPGGAWLLPRRWPQRELKDSLKNCKDFGLQASLSFQSELRMLQVRFSQGPSSEGLSPSGGARFKLAGRALGQSVANGTEIHFIHYSAWYTYSISHWYLLSIFYIIIYYINHGRKERFFAWLWLAQSVLWPRQLQSSRPSFAKCAWSHSMEDSCLFHLVSQLNSFCFHLLRQSRSLSTAPGVGRKASLDFEKRQRD